MLDQMRQGSKNVFIYLFFGVLIVVFTFYFGPGTDGCQPSSRELVASSVGYDIYNTDLQALLNRVSQRQNKDDADFQKLEKQAAEMFALVYLLSEEAKANGFAATDEELAEFIKDGDRNFDFQIYSQDGKFDPEIYQNFVEHGLLMTIEDYQEYKRRELIVSKYMAVLESSITVPDNEVEAINRQRNTRVELEFVSFEPAALEEVITFEQAQVDEYAAKNADAIKKYYDDNPKEFGTPKQVHLRRIMVRKPAASAPDGDKKKAEEKWARVKDRIFTKKDDFETVVGEESDDIVYKSKGGDMGWTELGFMEKGQAALVEAMKQGELREHESDIAWLILRLDEVKEAVVTPFEQVRADIARKLMAREQTQAEIRRFAESFLAEARKDPKKGFEEVLTALRPAPPTPNPENPENPENPPAPEPKKTVWDVVKVQTTGKFAREPRRSFKWDPEKGGPVAASLPWSDLPRIGNNLPLAKAAFELSPEAPLHEPIVEQEGKLYVVRLKERTEPTEDDLKKSRPGVEGELRRQILNDSIGAWQVIFYNPSPELAEASPFLNQMLEKAREGGRVRFTPKAAPAATDADAGSDAGTNGATDGAAPASAPAEKK